MSPDQTFKIYRVFSRVFYTFLSEPRVKWKTIWNNWTWPRYVRVIWCNNSVRDRLFRSRVTVLISQLPDKQLITTHEGTCWQSPILRLICTTIVDWRPPLVPKGIQLHTRSGEIVPRILLVINIFIPLANIVANCSVIN